MLAADGSLQRMNRAGLDIIQADSLDQVQGQCVFPLVSDEHREQFESLLKDVFLGKSGTIEFKVTGLKGRSSWLYSHMVPLRDAGGKIISALSVTVDVTDRKKIEEALKESEDRLRSIFEGMLDGILIADTETRTFVDTNSAFCAMLGYSREEVLALSIADIHPAGDLPAVLDAFERQSRGMATLASDIPMLRKDGSVFYVDVNASLVPLGGKVCLLGIFRDVTERKQAEEKIRQNEEFIRSILDTVDEGFIVIDRNYRILTANKAYCGQVGRVCDDIIGRHCYEISHNASRPCYEQGEECAVRQVFATGKPHAALHKHSDIGGHIIYVETKGYPIHDAAGNVVSVIETINNITERQLLAEERLKTQKLESIGTLAGGIAHDFNNLLQGIFGYISMAKMVLDQKEKALSMIEQAEEALHLSVNLTTQLLTFSKGGKPAKKPLRIRAIVENAVKFALSGSHTGYVLEGDDDLWPVEADPGQLSQVIQNLALNANDAMAGGGTIVIAVRNEELSAEFHPGLPGGGRFIRIDITDSGTGIPEKNLARLFDPYFTTKQRGSGLGLATSYSIIKNHGGIIEVRSEVGTGSTFSIFLPATDAPVLPEETAAKDHVPARRGRVLVMDDEEMVRGVAREMIAALGHEVVCAADGAEAIEIFTRAREQGTPFDVVILDLTVRGGMGGEETIRRLREIAPGVVAVVSSGYADNPVVSSYREHGFSAMLSKPYQLASLSECLTKLIQES